MGISTYDLIDNEYTPDKNICRETGSVCFNRGCGMFHENCLMKNNMQNSKQTVDDIRRDKYDCEQALNKHLAELTAATGLQVTYINVENGKVKITLSLE